jgi:hypothetical protein
MHRRAAFLPAIKKRQPVKENLIRKDWFQQQGIMKSTTMKSGKMKNRLETCF